MATITETVYLARDNTIDLLLKADGVITDLTPVTRIDLIDTGCAWEVSSTTSPNAFDWSGGVSGVLILALGDEVIPAGSYRARVILYDATNTDGIVWGEIKLNFKTACAAII
jgi:hypothetical protein